MGVRLYSPTAGRFLSVDPVAGGSCNNYDYTCQDPANKFDLDGRCWNPVRHKCWTYHAAAATWDLVKMGAYVGSMVDGGGEAVGGYRAYRFYRSERAAGRAAKFRPLGKGFGRWRRLGDMVGIVSGVTGFGSALDDFSYHASCLRGFCQSRSDLEKQWRNEFRQPTRRPRYV
jgi:hypothetical protein